MVIREGRWDCPSCGAAAQLGRNVHCTGCGAPRPESIEFYLPEDEPEVTEAARLAEANAGPDWVCEHCGGSARARDAFCPGCGAPHGTSADREARDYGIADTPRSGHLERPAAPPPSAVRPPKPSHTGRNVFLVLVLAVAAWFGWSNRTRHLQGEITAKAWERSVQVEAYRTVRDEGWTLPGDARLLRSYRAIRGYRQLLDHYETRTRQVSERVQVGTETYTCGHRSRGNGYFEDRTCTRPEYETRYHTETYQDPVYRQVPVWDTKYEYTQKRWVPDTLLATRGDTSSPVWPRTVRDDTTRDGEKKERYVLTFQASKDESFTTEVPVRDFTAHRLGEHVPLVVHGGTATIDTAH